MRQVCGLDDTERTQKHAYRKGTKSLQVTYWHLITIFLKQKVACFENKQSCQKAINQTSCCARLTKWRCRDATGKKITYWLCSLWVWLCLKWATGTGTITPYSRGIKAAQYKEINNIVFISLAQYKELNRGLELNTIYFFGLVSILHNREMSL